MLRLFEGPLPDAKLALGLSACLCWFVLASIIVNAGPAATGWLGITTALGTLCSTSSQQPLTSQVLHSIAMAGAMMLPLLIGTVNSVALATPHGRRHIAILEIALVYWALWSIFNLAMSSVIAAAGQNDKLAPVALTSVVLWQKTKIKQRALRACIASPTLRLDEPGATIDRIEFGATTFSFCALTCAPAMLAAHLLHGGLLTIAAMTTFLIVERYVANFNSPSYPVRALGAVLVGGALSFLVP